MDPEIRGMNLGDPHSIYAAVDMNLCVVRTDHGVGNFEDEEGLN